MADVVTHYDAWKDIRSGSLSGPDESTAPNRLIGDITRTRITHQGSIVRVATYYRALPREGRLNTHHIRIKTPKVERFIRIDASPGSWAGTLTLTKPASTARLSESQPADETATCSGIRYVIEYSHNRVVVEIPRSCLRYPDFVRAGSRFYSKNATREFYDDAFDVRSEPLDAATLGPAVHR